MGPPGDLTHRGGPAPAPDRARPSPSPQAELVSQLGALGQTPAAVAAGVIGIGTFAVVFITGFVLAALPDASLIGFLGADAGYVEEAFRQMVQLVLAGFENDSLFDAFRNTSRVAPGLFALVPTLTALYLARAQLGRLQGSSLGAPARRRRRRRLPVRAADDHPRAADRRPRRRRRPDVRLRPPVGPRSARSPAPSSPRRRAGAGERVPARGRTYRQRRAHRAAPARPRAARHHRARHRDLDRRRRRRPRHARQPLAADRARRHRAVRGRPRRPHVRARHARRVRAPRAPAVGARAPAARRESRRDRRQAATRSASSPTATAPARSSSC